MTDPRLDSAARLIVCLIDAARVGDGAREAEASQALGVLVAALLAEIQELRRTSKHAAQDIYH